MTQIVHAFIEIKKCLVLIVNKLGLQLLLELLLSSELLAPLVELLDVWNVCVRVLLFLNLVHGVKDFGRVNHAVIAMALFEAFIE